MLSKLLSSSEFWSAMIGALVGGFFAVLAQILTSREQRKRDLQTERRSLRATLQAIYAELEILKTDHFLPLQKQLENWVPGVYATVPVLQNRCSVYESNVAYLGKIDSPELIKKIVSVYGQIKGLMDQMNLNSQRFINFTDILRKQDRGLQIQGTELQAGVAELTQIRDNMERSLGTLMYHLNQLLEDLRNYIKANSG
jgi:hypothetical protein